jgi:DNA (cytosine-5)-methyltransferase 1
VGAKPTFIDLFAGAGLFSAGLIRAGFEPVLAVELSPEAVVSYRRNVFDCVKQGLVEKPSEVPRADVLIAGPPCQGFSTLGRRDPTDARNDLSLAILPWVKAARPQIVVVENVPPFLVSRQWARLKRALQAMGFSVCAWELEAAQFGIPQRRRRAFTVASRRGPIEAPRPHRRPVSAGEVLFDASHPLRSDDPMHVWPEPKGVAAQRIRLVPPRGDKRDIVAKAPSLCPPSWFKIGCQATDAWGRLDPDEPANTIRCTFQNPSKGRYLHPTENRVLSLREGARLQGVPDDWVFEGLPYPIARQIGNGVPVNLAKAVGRRIAASLG